jgi:hypothetical protein
MARFGRGTEFRASWLYDPIYDQIILARAEWVSYEVCSPEWTWLFLGCSVVVRRGKLLLFRGRRSSQFCKAQIFIDPCQA